MAELTDTDPEIRERVRERYAAAATAIADPAPAVDPMAEATSCCGPAAPAGSSCCAPVSLQDAAGHEVFGGSLYDGEDGAQDAPVQASLGCGVPTAVADLRDGDVVLDLGSGAGVDVLISARRVAPSGRAIGLDMTDEMLELARANAAAAGVANVEFVKGHLEELPLADRSVDVVISNCVINLSGDKPRVLREAARVLRPGGRFAVSDVIADPDMDKATRADMALWTGCIAGALTRGEFRIGADRRRPRGHRGPGDPSCPRACGGRDRAGMQARGLTRPTGRLAPRRRLRRTRRSQGPLQARE